MSLAAHSDRSDPTRRLEMVLGTYARLSPEDAQLLRTGLVKPQRHIAGAPIEPPSGVTGRAQAVLSGWVGLVAQLPDGRRQVISVAMAGELIPDPLGSGFTTIALTSVQTADAGELVAALDRAAETPDAASGLGQAWRRACRAAAGRQLNHILRLGRLSAVERMASLFLELHERQRRAGLASDTAMPFPLTQEVLADLLGLSGVHVNRTLRQLRDGGLIVYRAGQVTFPDRERLIIATGLKAS